MKLPLWIPPLWIAAWMGVCLWQQVVAPMGWGRELAAGLAMGGGSLLLWLALKDGDEEDE